MASDNSEREKVYDLFERAVKDYICKLLLLLYFKTVLLQLCLKMPFLGNAKHPFSFSLLQNMGNLVLRLNQQQASWEAA